MWCHPNENIRFVLPFDTLYIRLAMNFTLQICVRATACLCVYALNEMNKKLFWAVFFNIKWENLTFGIQHELTLIQSNLDLGTVLCRVHFQSMIYLYHRASDKRNQWAVPARTHNKKKQEYSEMGNLYANEHCNEKCKKLTSLTAASLHSSRNPLQFGSQQSVFKSKW